MKINSTQMTSNTYQSQMISKKIDKNGDDAMKPEQNNVSTKNSNSNIKQSKIQSNDNKVQAQREHIQQKVVDKKIQEHVNPIASDQVQTTKSQPATYNRQAQTKPIEQKTSTSIDVTV
ncbi:hypothetical protein [Alkaliphilus sp. B6464]|uniref:hypothetical protein n=1 Tax=Alkaliphilus sp. B6464 TaxID=2731219 RepID=UPI001BAA83FC|nr:hypothetical protein [Alkaliphilus sp. B6464]QUH22105.1 hypothetical protein HYG84_19555 [Alkaliphilus sp. B6464]